MSGRLFLKTYSIFNEVLVPRSNLGTFTGADYYQDARRIFFGDTFSHTAAA